MRRREFIAVISSAAVAARPLAALSQQRTIPIVGFLDGRSPDGLVNRLRGFHKGLRETGYVDGENLIIAYRWAENEVDRLPVLAAELVRQQVAVIATGGGDRKSTRL